MPLEFKQVTHRYGDEINGRAALKDVSLTISENSFTGLVGHTGSGKSTLVQLAGSLLMPSEGAVLIDGVNSRQKGDAARAVKRRVGLVFQDPEHQLFEETVLKDVAFGPQN
ncbi:MAG: ATP-binding cassette domain-containing protein, partial [Peptococcus niger]